MRFKGKVALVTGGASGIGEAIALRFASEGANVAINYHPGGKHRGEDVLSDIAKRGQSGIAIAANVDQRPEVEDMFSQIMAKFGRVDIVVNNVGIEFKKPFIEVTDEEWNKVISVNLFGAFLV